MAITLGSEATNCAIGRGAIAPAAYVRKMTRSSPPAAMASRAHS